MQGFIGGARGKQHGATIGDDGTIVSHGRVVARDLVQSSAVDGKLDQAVAVEIERKSIAGRQRDPAKSGLNGSGVTHARSDQRDQSLFSNGYVAKIGDCRAPRAGDREAVVAGHEVFVADIRRRGNEPGNVDPCAGAEHDALWIDQHEDAVAA